MDPREQARKNANKNKRRRDQVDDLGNLNRADEADEQREE